VLPVVHFPGLSPLAASIDAALPQTQCTRCGYPDCRSYAQAVADGQAGINQCPPGGDAGVHRLSVLTGRPVVPLDAVHGTEGPLRLALIDEGWCIGCTLCIKACPVDCIVGAPKQMHTVVAAQCTGCELCVPACPVDCITLVDARPGSTGWDAWSDAQAAQARDRHDFRRVRLQQAQHDNDERLAAKAERKLADLPGESRLTDPAALERKRSVIEQALARARARRATAP
jgi:Na+-translocating ferredoxin:NAD+ oxidoreductase subunit B